MRFTIGRLLFFFLLGDWARFPLEFRRKRLITAAIVVADINETKPQSKTTTAVFLYRPKL